MLLPHAAANELPSGLKAIECVNALDGMDPAAVAALIEAAEAVVGRAELPLRLGESIDDLKEALSAMRGERSDERLRRMIREAIVPRELRPETNAEIEQLLDSPEMRGEGKAKP